MLCFYSMIFPIHEILPGRNGQDFFVDAGHRKERPS